MQHYLGYRPDPAVATRGISPSFLRGAVGHMRLMLELERERWPLWSPVAFGCGIAVFFSLDHEPSFWSLGLFAGVALAVGLFLLPRERRIASWLGTLALLATAGFLAAQWRSASVEAPVIAKRGSYMVEGRIALIEPRARGPRVLLDRLSIEGIEPERTPVHVRITLKGSEPRVETGDRIRMKAMLQAPGSPLLPGGFDFARKAYFERLGGFGFAYRPAEIVEHAAQADFRSIMADLRASIARKVQDALPGAEGAVAAALLTALRADISDKVWEDMQIAGLAHLLAISGLHMGLVAGTVLLFFRYFLALFPWIALRWPVIKPSAAIALAAAAFYLLLAGASVPTQRAFFMAGVGLVAIIIDRNPFSMRLVAVAALLILAVKPEALLGPSFQMSFAAVVALIAVYEHDGLAAALSPRRTGDEARRSGPLSRYLLGVALTTAVASLATLPFAAYHFQRISLLGIVANLVGVPLTAFWIMPAGLLALAAMPFGLEAPFLFAMGHGIAFLLDIAASVAELPGAGLRIALQPLSILLFAVAGGLWLCLWQQSWRWYGVLLWPVAVILAWTHQPPDLVVDRAGNLAALRREDGGITMIRFRRNDFVESAWLRALGTDDAIDAPAPGASPAEGMACDEGGCRFHIGGFEISLARSPAAAIEDCRDVDLVIALRSVDDCPGGAGIIGSRDLWLSGGMSISIRHDRIEMRRVAGEAGVRYWTEAGQKSTYSRN